MNHSEFKKKALKKKSVRLVYEALDPVEQGKSGRINITLLMRRILIHKNITKYAFQFYALSSFNKKQTNISFFSVQNLYHRKVCKHK